jgi:hypothetical protein
VIDEPLSMVALVLGLRLEKRRQLAQPLHVKVGRDREILEISAEFHPDLLVNGLVDCWIYLHRSASAFAVRIYPPRGTLSQKAVGKIRCTTQKVNPSPVSMPIISQLRARGNHVFQTSTLVTG